MLDRPIVTRPSTRWRLPGPWKNRPLPEVPKENLLLAWAYLPAIWRNGVDNELRIRAGSDTDPHGDLLAALR